MWFRGDNVTRNYTVDASHLGVKRLSTGELKLHKICWDGTFFFSTAKNFRDQMIQEIYNDMKKYAKKQLVHVHTVYY